ncbi:MAG TPA: hypothetical protein ENI67_07320 [Gammaproteobacteria bacterium]|nr:hypothetical protein [Gammaproteobacteria bacterium]
MNKLRFLHIPKTAGSTFSSILTKQYRGKVSFEFSGDNELDIKRFRELSLDEQKAVVLFTGHAPILTGLPEADDIAIITILRDPISRVKSFCQHVSEGKSPHLVASFPPESFTLDEFLYSGNNEISNLQARMLIDYERHRVEPLVTSFSMQELKNRALENLFEKVRCFGIQEYFDESLILFADTLGWSMPFYEYQNRKDINRLLKFEDYHIERIQELNAVDIAVYQAAKEWFLDKIESDDYSRRKLAVFKQAKRIISPALHTYRQTGRTVVRFFR